MVFQLLRITIIVFVSIVLLAGCGRQAGSVEPEPPEDMMTSEEPAMQEEMVDEMAVSDQEIAERAMVAEEQARQAEAMRLAEMTQMASAAFVNEDVHFAFDSSLLEVDAERILEQKATWLQDNGGASVQIEGHCDERGTSAYNLALGERRANAVQEYLTVLGVDPSRLSTISYGEELPLDPGHDETAWSSNRRAHFVILP
jgi:peptidoglycan-associated lipoprotein